MLKIKVSHFFLCIATFPIFGCGLTQSDTLNKAAFLKEFSGVYGTEKPCALVGENKEPDVFIFHDFAIGHVNCPYKKVEAIKEFAGYKVWSEEVCYETLSEKNSPTIEVASRYFVIKRIDSDMISVSENGLPAIKYTSCEALSKDVLFE